jgi:2-iminobutanoate/2-iminopropanoate deaminase
MANYQGGFMMSAPIGPYSPIVRAGDLLITSGQLGLAPGAEGVPALVEGGTGAQLHQALVNGAALLEGEGAAITDIVKATVFLTDMSEFSMVNEIWIDFFSGHRPSRSAIGVAALPMGATIEVELWAHVDS